MAVPDEVLIEQLVASDEEFRTLVEDHRKLGRSLDEMGQRRYLSEAENREMAVLKKKKLAMKDRIYQRIAEYRRTLAAS